MPPARPDACRHRGAAGAPVDDDAVRDARPGRGDDDGPPHRGHERGAAAAGGGARGAVHAAGQHLRGPLPREPGHEPGRGDARREWERERGAGNTRGTLAVAFPGASVPLPEQVADAGAGLRTRRRARPAPRGAPPERRRGHRGDGDHRGAARRGDPRHLPHRGRHAAHRAPAGVRVQAGAGGDRAHRHRRGSGRRTTSSTPRRGQRMGARRCRRRWTPTSCTAAGTPRPACKARRRKEALLAYGLLGAGARALRRLRVLSLLPQLQADAVRDAAGAGRAGALRRAAARSGRRSRRPNSPRASSPRSSSC